MSCASDAGLNNSFGVIRDPWPEDGFACNENALGFALVVQMNCV